MKKVQIIIAALITVGVWNISQAQVQHAKPATPASLEKQAENQAHAFWNGKITTCGGDYYTLDRGYIHQFRGASISVNTKIVSAADRLNGIEWRGTTTLSVQQSRTYSPKATLYQNVGWSK